jgi:hypothetical protein
MVISQNTEIGSDTTAIPSTGKSARTPQIMEARKMINEGAVSRMEQSFFTTGWCQAGLSAQQWPDKKVLLTNELVS